MIRRKSRSGSIAGKVDEDAIFAENAPSGLQTSGQPALQALHFPDELTGSIRVSGVPLQNKHSIIRHIALKVVDIEAPWAHWA